MAFYGYACTECGSPDCDGCPEAEDPIDSEMLSLLETPEGMDLTPVEKTGEMDLPRHPPAPRAVRRWRVRKQLTPRGRGLIHRTK
jgi:hypothetical protein